MFKNFTISDYAAWWGAIVATGVALFEFVKWLRSGPRLSLETRGNMKMWNEYNGENEETFINFTVTNRGDSPTTLNTLSVFHYSSLIKYVFKKPAPEAHLIVPTAPLNKPLPHKIDVGDCWTCNFPQSEEYSDMAKNGYLCAAIHYSHSKKPIKRRIRIRNVERENG